MTRNSRRSTADSKSTGSNRRTSKGETPRKKPDSRQGDCVVLGLDPGTLVTGYGIVAHSGGVVKLVACGTIRNNPGSPMDTRLQRIFGELSALIARHHPGEFAIESAFYGKNAQSALKLGHARGVSILAAAESGLVTAEYSPREVKKAIVGTGTASKEQVRFMVRSLLHLDSRPSVSLDASDALAIALCHINTQTPGRSRHRDWSSFVATHPERVVP
jgi:crossover junction endodeoxyribonuclease RuvC